jgi:glycosyltransferase involved in cell wall biosynthesis
MNSSTLDTGSDQAPAVSVIVNCYNEAKHLPETLDSVFAQTFQDWEIIFWDNASTDSSSEIASSYGNRVRCFRGDTMVPLGRARKLAYEQCRGKYVAILDADDIWLPRKLERQVELFASDSRVGMTYCGVIYFDDSGERQRLFALTQPHRGKVFGQLLTKNFIFSSAMMFSREALDDLGCAFDDKFTRAQDYDLSLRVAYQYRVDYVDEPLLKWRMSLPEDKPWKKTLVSRAAEVQESLEGLLETFPEIKHNYRAELKSFYRNLEYSFGVSAWQAGDRSKARAHLSRHLIDRKFAFVYLCTFLLSFNMFYFFRIAVRDMTKGRL